MTLPSELANARSAGEALTRARLPWGPIILDWFAADCEGSLEALLGLGGPAAHGKSRTRAVRRYWWGERLREAAKLLPPYNDDLPRRLRRAYQAYRRDVWPCVRTEDYPPSEHSEIDRLLFQAMKKWPHDLKTSQAREILSE